MGVYGQELWIPTEDLVFRWRPLTLELLDDQLDDLDAETPAREDIHTRARRTIRR